MRRGEIHPQARAVIEAVLPALLVVLRASHGPVALVVVAVGREGVDLGAGAKVSPEGHRYTALPLERAQQLADEATLQVGVLLREPLEPGAVWCLVLAPQGAAAVPIVRAGGGRQVPQA